MEITPNGRLYLLNNLKIDNTYENTIIFDSKQAQYNYFISKCPNLATYGFTQVNYQRVNKGVIAIHGMAENVMKCNYMMFQNSLIFQYENSSSTTTFDWVYAFITDVVYKNTNCCEVHYEIDVMQTFMFSYNLGQCFVEREHTPSDEIGEHIIDEGLPVGDYEYTPVIEQVWDDVASRFHEETMFDNDSALTIVLACTFNDQYQKEIGAEYGGFFSGLIYHMYPNTPQGRSDCKTFINGATAMTDGIVAIFYVPTWCAEKVIQSQTGSNTPFKAHYFYKNQFYGDFGAYHPVNNKMYTYPYNYMYVYNVGNQAAEYKLEKWAEESDPQIPSYGMLRLDEFFDFSCSPSCVVWPRNYEQILNNYMESLSLGPFPQLSWVSDTYKAWIAQNGTSLLLSGISSAMGVGAGLMQTNAQYSTGMASAYGGTPAWKFYPESYSDFSKMGAYASQLGAAAGIAHNVANGVGAALNIIGQIIHAKLLPNQAHGNTNSSQLHCAKESMRFWAYRRYIRPDYAKTIDDYFTMYGYKVNKLETPNVKVRKQFTYIKTLNCLVAPKNGINVPKVYADAIATIYNNGVRTWINGDNIGNYSLDNSPLTQGA